MHKQRFGNYFIEHRIFAPAQMEKIAIQQQVHNRRVQRSDF
jgi:hypothetical protein